MLFKTVVSCSLLFFAGATPCASSDTCTNSQVLLQARSAVEKKKVQSDEEWLPPGAPTGGGFPVPPGGGAQSDDPAPGGDEREPCDGTLISDKGNRYPVAGPWRLKKRMPPPVWGEWPGFHDPAMGLAEEAAVPGARKQDVDFIGWIWVFGAWEDKKFKMVSVDRSGKKLECRYSKREDINTTFMPDLLTAEELQPYWDIAVRNGENPAERPDFHEPPGSYTADVEVFCKKNTHHCDETLHDRGGEGYRGCQSFTRHGEPCQKWTDQSPITHNNTPELKPGKGLGDHNFCRNPDGMQTIWCYIAKENTNADRRRACKKNPTYHSRALWEWCLPMEKYAPPGQTTTTTTTVCQPIGDFVVRKIKKDHACNARDRQYLGKLSKQRCAEAVRANGYKFMHWVKWCATGGCGAVGTKSAECREGFRYSTKYDFYEIKELGGNQTYAKHSLIKAGHTCKSGESFLGWMSSAAACANAVKLEGGNFFTYGNGVAPHSAGACYKEDAVSSSCTEGWEQDQQYDFYALDQNAEVPSHSGVECWNSQCCHSEGSAPCTWCGGADWYCCDATKQYPSGDKCSQVEIINATRHWTGRRRTSGKSTGYGSDNRFRCAELKPEFRSKPAPAPPVVPVVATPTKAPTASPTKAPPQPPTGGGGAPALCGAVCSSKFAKCFERNSPSLGQSKAYALCQKRKGKPVPGQERWKCAVGCGDTAAMTALKGGAAPTPAPPKKPTGGSSDAAQCGATCSQNFVWCIGRQTKKRGAKAAYPKCKRMVCQPDDAGKCKGFPKWKCDADCSDTTAMAGFKV